MSTEEELKARIVTYWDYKVKEEFDKSYAYEEPLYKKNVNPSTYIMELRKKRLKWLGASIEDILIEGELARVKMQLKVKIPFPPKDFVQEVSLDEKWVKVDGVWYHLLKKQ